MKVLKPSINLLVLTLVLFSALLAELHRVHGFLLLDLLAPPLIWLWLLERWWKKKPIQWPSTVLSAGLFLAIGLGSLFLNNLDLSNGEFLSCAFYAIRWASLFLLSVLVLNQSPAEKNTTWKLLVGFGLFLALAGFVQLILVPDFTAYEELGWDPHQGRLLSTWFDPNFVGGYLAFFSPLLLGYSWDQPKARRWTLPILVILVLAAALTLSRSAYLALFAGLTVFCLFRSLKTLAAGAILLILLGVAVPAVGDRFTSLVDNVTSVATETYTLPDASARLRYDSWRTGWQLFLSSPLIGHGYNAYKFAAIDQKLLKDTEIHAASGSDSSLLTILATSGIAGLLPFLSLYALLFLTAWKQRKNSFALGALGGLSGLFLHSIFVNSLLFPLFMAPFWVSMGLLQTSRGGDEWPNPDR